MPYTSIDDIARKKAALKAKLTMQEKQMSALKTALLSPTKPVKSNRKSRFGFLGNMDTKSLLSAAISTADGVWFAWKLYRKLKK